MVMQEHSTARATAEVARRVTGVWEVADRLVVGRDEARAVAEALAHDPRTARSMIEATASDGGLTLRGQVRAVREKEAAVEVARGVAGVVAVIDELEIQADASRRDGPPPLDSLLALGSRIGPLK